MNAAGATFVCDGTAGNAGSDGSANIDPGTDAGDLAVNTTGIVYNNIDVSRVDIDNVDVNRATNEAVVIRVPTTTTNDLVVNLGANAAITAANPGFGAINVRGRNAIEVNSAADITAQGTTGFKVGLQVQGTTGGGQVVNLTGGAITTLGETGPTVGVWNFDNGVDSLLETNNHGADIVAGSAATTGPAQGIYTVSFYNNANSGAVNVNMSSGSIAVLGGSATRGIRARNDGYGAVNVNFTGGTIDVAGTQANGIRIERNGTGPSAVFNDVSLLVSNASITSTDTGIFARTLGNGGANITLDGANIVAGDAGVGVGLDVSVGGQTNTGELNAVITGSTISAGFNGAFLSTNSLGAVNVEITDSTITGDGANGVLAQIGNGSSSEDVTVSVTGSTLTGAQRGLTATNFGAGNTSVEIVDSTLSGGTNAGIDAGINGSGSVNVTVTGGSVEGALNGILARHTNRSGISFLGNAYGTPGAAAESITVTANSDITATGPNGVGIRASSIDTFVDFSDIFNLEFKTYLPPATPVSITVSGGTVTGGGGPYGAAIATNTTGGATIDIAAGATIDGSASGIAIRDGDTLNAGGNLGEDGIDKVANDAVVTTRGTITGDAILGLGDDIFNFAGGVISGDIYGDDKIASENDGDDAFNWTGGDFNSGFFGMNGSDVATVDAGAVYDGLVDVLDGGDDVSTADGWIDTLNLNGQIVQANGANIINWEVINLNSGTRLEILDGTLTTGSEQNTGLFVNAGAILNQPSGLTLTGNLVNAGMVNMQSGATGAVINVSGDYTGLDGTLQVDTDFAADASDTLVVGGNATGTTTVSINDVSTGDATGNDILVVDVGGTSAAGAFAAPTTAVGAYLYDLNQVGQDWYLQANDAVVPTVESFAPTLTVVQDMGRDFIGTLWERVGHRETGFEARGRGDGNGVWGRAHGKLLHGDNKATSTGASLEASHGFLQAGVDFAGLSMEEGDLVLSLMGHYGASDTDVDNVIGNKISDVDIDGYGVGGSVTFYNAAQTFYVDAVGQATWYDVKINSTVFGNEISRRTASAKTDGFGYAFSLETGYRHSISNTWAFVPQAQLIYSNSDFDNTVDSEGVALSVDSGKSLEGRIGLALEGHSDVSFGYFRLNLIEEFKGKNAITASGTRFTTSVHGTSGEMSAGGSFEVRPGIRLYTDVTGRVGFSNGIASARGTAGVKVNW